MSEGLNEGLSEGLSEAMCEAMRGFEWGNTVNKAMGKATSE